MELTNYHCDIIAAYTSFTPCTSKVNSTKVEDK